MVEGDRRLLNVRAIRATFRAAMHDPSADELAPRFVARANQLLDAARLTADSEPIRIAIAEAQTEIDEGETRIATRDR